MAAAAGRRWRAAMWAAVGSFVAASWHLLDSAERSELEPAFIGPWALSWCALVAAAATCAYMVSRGRDDWAAPVGHSLAQAFVAAAGVALFFGVTLELEILCRQQFASPEGARLASGLSISAWWILFSAVLVTLGFRRGLAGLRITGLGVAAVAVIKVLFRDLSSLDAFYRIGSVFILGIVSLALAWLYHRHARVKPENA
jgi:uncharacterized membrane protein